MENMTKKQFIDLIVSTVKEAVKELGATETRKGVVFETEDTSAEEIEKLSPKEKFIKFLKEGVFAKDSAVVKALGGGVGADGGFLIPTEFVAEIVADLPKLSPIRGMATVINVSSRKGEIPKLAGRPNASWDAENSTAVESNPSFGQLQYSLNKLRILSAMSEELLSDSAIDLAGLIRRLFTEEIAMAENEAFTNGDGVGKPTGFRNATITTVATAFGYDAIVDLRYAIESQYTRNAVFMTSRKGMSALRKIKDASGRPIFDPVSETVMGIRVIENPDIPENLGAGLDETEIWYGDFRNYWIFDAQEYAVKVSTEGGNAFLNDQVLMKVYNRLDGKVALEKAFAKLTGVK